MVDDRRGHLITDRIRRVGVSGFPHAPTRRPLEEVVQMLKILMCPCGGKPGCPVCVPDPPESDA